jgi:hypothetical protein
MVNIVAKLMPCKLNDEECDATDDPMKIYSSAPLTARIKKNK